MDQTEPGVRPRTLAFVLAACWGTLGLWVLSTGWTWLGLAQMSLASAYLVSTFSPRFAAFMDRPPFGRRKREPSRRAGA